MKDLDQLAGSQINLRKKQTGKWRAFIYPSQFESNAGEGNTVIEALQALIIKLQQEEPHEIVR